MNRGQLNGPRHFQLSDLSDLIPPLRWGDSNPSTRSLRYLRSSTVRNRRPKPVHQWVERFKPIGRRAQPLPLERLPYSRGPTCLMFIFPQAIVKTGIRPRRHAHLLCRASPRWCSLCQKHSSAPGARLRASVHVFSVSVLGLDCGLGFENPGYEGSVKSPVISLGDDDENSMKHSLGTGSGRSALSSPQHEAAVFISPWRDATPVQTSQEVLPIKILCSLIHDLLLR